MKSKYHVYQINSFTNEAFTGNPAGVVSNANGLTEAQMQLIAREMNNSETAFIFQPETKDAGYDVEVRFFTPTTEVPICGHATIAAHYVRALEKKALPGQTFFQKTKAGILPVEIIGDEENIRIKMTQGQASFRTIAFTDQQSILQALGITEDERDANCPIQIVSTGHSKIMIGIKSRNKLNQLSPELNELVLLSKKLDCNGFFVFSFDSEDPQILTYGRMFAPAIGIAEDPVTGNANGPLGAYLVENKIVPHNGRNFSFIGKQGEALKRPGTVAVSVGILNDHPVKIEIIGNAVSVFKTTIEI
ncbi:PhzF family isomerase [Mucilaginibacter sp.]|uniref:PhzF family isomerase n=1 Tax=Mucilaginibacter sp. TaxID=1882438 RepID=UPI0032635A03